MLDLSWWWLNSLCNRLLFCDILILMLLEWHVHDVLKVFDLSCASLVGFVVVEVIFTLIMTDFEAGLLLFFEYFFELLSSEFLHGFLVVGKSSIYGDLFNLSLNPASDHSIDGFFLINGKSGWHVLACTLLRLFGFFLDSNFWFESELIFIFLEFIVNSGFIMFLF